MSTQPPWQSAVVSKPKPSTIKNKRPTRPNPVVTVHTPSILSGTADKSSALDDMIYDTSSALLDASSLHMSDSSLQVDDDEVIPVHGTTNGYNTLHCDENIEEKKIDNNATDGANADEEAEIMQDIVTSAISTGSEGNELIEIEMAATVSTANGCVNIARRDSNPVVEDKANDRGTSASFSCLSFLYFVHYMFLHL